MLITRTGDGNRTHATCPGKKENACVVSCESKLEQCLKSVRCFRFDALKLLDVLRNKRLMFIGDSVQRSTFESMVCMVQSVIPDKKKSFHRIPPMKIFKAEVHTRKRFST